MKNFRARRAAGFFIFLAVFAAVSAIVMLLWNAIIPQVIGWSAVTYWQSAGLILLGRLLLGGIGKWAFAGRMHGCHGKEWNARREQMMHMHEKMHGMSRSERRDYVRSRMAGFADECCRDSRAGKAGDGRQPGAQDGE